MWQLAPRPLFWTPMVGAEPQLAKADPQFGKPAKPVLPKGAKPFLSVEQQAVKDALAFETQGQLWVQTNPMDPNNVNGYRPRYAEAAGRWMKARDAATQIAFSTTTDPPPTSHNAGLRSIAYETRRLADMDVATGKAARPVPGFVWPPIDQDPVPGTDPPAPDPNAPSDTGGPSQNQVADFAGGVGFTALLLGLGYLAWRLIAKRPLP